MISFRGLTRYAKIERRAPSRGVEQCELCGASMAPIHSHVVDLERRTLCCTCRPCALLFYDVRASHSRYRTVPDRVIVDPALELTEDEWSALKIPVRLAFVFYNSVLNRWVAVYPSPAGPTESEIDDEAWCALSSRSATLDAIEPDVEALLVRGRRGESGFTCFVAPIDACYELVARVRKHWKGFDGGDVVRDAVDSFFAQLTERSRAPSQAERVEP